MRKLWKTVPGTSTPKLVSSHEELFVDHYHQLVEWALRLTGNDRHLAEDLVQDSFVQFTFRRPDLSSIENLEAYLYGILRNTHRLELRRAAHCLTRQPAVVDYDSADICLRRRDVGDQIAIREDLRRVCQYACARKESSRAGSVLILRFFHGYYPGEIALIIGSSRPSVSQLLRMARDEARLYLENPRSLSFLAKPKSAADSHDAALALGPTSIALSSEDLLRQFRSAVFRSRRGDCLWRESLDRLYRGDAPSALDCATLAHLVCCAPCLDQVNTLLGFAPLSSRFPTDTLGPEKPDKPGKSDGGGKGRPGGTPSGGGSLKDALDKCRRRARQVFEHQPHELCISVNGDIQVWRTITTAVTEQIISLDENEKVELVDVTSDQGIRLMCLTVESGLPESLRQSERVQLSDGRTLEITLDHGSLHPKLQVIYTDPWFDRLNADLPVVVSSSEEKELAPPAPAPGHGHDDSGYDDPNQSGLSWRRRRSVVQILGHAVRSVLRSIGLALLRLTASSGWARSGLATVSLAVLVVAAVLIVRHPGSRVAAAKILARSTQAEDAFAQKPDQVLHRTISLEGHKLAGAEAPVHRKIESWYSPTQELIARRVYDDGDQLIGGEWRRTDGQRTEYRRGTSPVTDASAPSASSISFENVWQLDLSAKDFTGLAGDDLSRARVEENSGSYLVNFDRDGQGLIRASLTVGKSDLHAAQLTLVVRQDDGEMEYLFAETSFERRSVSATAPAVFEPEPELSSPKADEGGREENRKKISVEPLTIAVPEAPTANPIASADLEMDVLSRLSQAGADLNDQTNVSRTVLGRLSVSGMVDTDVRKAEILSALAPVAANPAVELRVETVAEALKRQPPSQSAMKQVSLESAEVSQDRMPVYKELLGYFGRNRSEAQAEQEIDRFSCTVVSESRDAMSHAAAMKRLANRFSAEDLKALSPEAHAKWIAVIQIHARAFENKARSIREQLQPIFSPVGTAQSEGAQTAESIDVSSDANIVHAIDRLFQLGSVVDDAIGLALTVSNNNGDGEAIKTPDFWESILNAEKLAAKL